MRDLVIVSNRAPFAFSEAFLQGAEEAMRSDTAPVPPKFGEGGLVQAMAGLLNTEKWTPIWVGASMGNKDVEVTRGHYEALFDAIQSKGYTPQDFLMISIDPEGRLHFRFRDYDFVMRLVFFNTEHMESYYSTFANGFLWPLMHLTRSPLLYKTKERTFPRPSVEKNDFLQYTSSNVTFAHTVFDETLKSRDVWGNGEDFVVWIQDYHLMQVADFYRALVAAHGFSDLERKRIHVGQFMHTPFFNIHEIQGLIREDRRRRTRALRFDPFPETIESVLQKLTWGMLANDFIGFHHKEYCDNYLEALQEWFPRYHVDIRQRGQFYDVTHPNGITTLGVFPIGLDVGRILGEVSGGQVLEWEDDSGSLRDQIARDRARGCTIFGGLERCDYTKGLLARLDIFAHTLSLLRRSRQKRREARLYQVTSPSRSQSPDYQNLEAVIKDEIFHVNRQLAREFDPVVHLDQGVPPPQNYRFMKEVDVMLVTPLEDGMNLVALEYVLAQKYRKERGLLAIGHCGAARVLKSAGFGLQDGIVYIDPIEPEDAGEKIFNALVRGISISDRLVDHLESEFRVETWADSNIEAIIHCRRDAGVV
ncbi:MAG: trehalose-6-phosphate synthase [Syntrophobacteraceae bacterium]|nr:trehalose-6-phosphate synthase [Syntrophobacteraceae bacterium]